MESVIVDRIRGMGREFGIDERDIWESFRRIWEMMIYRTMTVKQNRAKNFIVEFNNNWMYANGVDRNANEIRERYDLAHLRCLL